ncbi:MAG TPA: (2Fe-2S)-binding protein [Anaerolineaceae bacterium]|nr:(2Fe-2S)-binding protein [Anaerolineaceae bacterium]
MKVSFKLNGSPVSIDTPVNITLLSLLREKFGLIGTKIGCEVGECGACSVLIDGKVVNSCMLLAPQINGRSVTTIEGIHDSNGGPNDLQRSLVENGAVQCGYCTPGMVMAGEALLAETLSPTENEIRNAIAGNLCRCTGYQQIVEAVETTATLRRKKLAAQPASLEGIR